MIGKNAVLLIVALASFHPIASAELAANEQEPAYFTIQDTSRNHTWTHPKDALEQGFEAFVTTASKLNLLKWLRHEGPPPQSPERYNRRLHFGTWVNDPHDQTCYNTRAKILMRDSLEPVQFRENNKCAVDKGLWVDPYTGGTRTYAREIQIDHVVPLKNAFVSGAWTWNTKKRCLYANFMANNFHLMAVDGIENMSKGDSAPDEYLPSNSRYVCRYLEEWLKIKLIWKLDMTQSEAQAIRSSIQEYGCNPKMMNMSQAELLKQRVATEEMQMLCERMARRLEQTAVKSHSEAVSFPLDETL